ncbi:hypothetical protein [Embleya sp. NBC_00896]|uniref:hypothetical protein n=1 Tax=Embleya sp. NBC_00896 TaxID=2975961 RepID=UPI00386F4A6D|nr:hypothetical protein OG928_27865 [Embleya sp. NBC_00896]
MRNPASVEEGDFVRTFDATGRRLGSGYVIARTRAADGSPEVTVLPRWGDPWTLPITQVRPAEPPPD